MCSTHCVWLYGVGHKVKVHSNNMWKPATTSWAIFLFLFLRLAALALLHATSYRQDWTSTELLRFILKLYTAPRAVLLL